MKRKVLIMLKVISCISIILLFSTVFHFENESAFASILTFLSITTGFSITALSIIASSKLSRKLYKIESKRNNSRTLLHELVFLFKNSTIIFVVTIILILLYQFLSGYDIYFFSIKIYEITLKKMLSSIVWFLTIISFIKFLYLFLTFGKFIIRGMVVSK
jgi:hypothetical protein